MVAIVTALLYKIYLQDHKIYLQDHKIYLQDQVIQENDRDRYQMSVERLVNEGLPELKASDIKQSSNSAASNSYNETSATIKPHPFGLLPNVGRIDPKKVSTLFAEIQVRGSLTYANEADVQNFVERVLLDMLLASGFRDRLDLRREIKLAKSYLHPDVLVFEVGPSGYRYPVCCVEVKKPGTNLKEEKIAGQIYGYMLQLRTLYGLVDVFGVLTTYQEWLVVWLPDCQELAGAQGVRDGNNKDPIAQILSKPRPPNVLHGTEIVRYNDLNLPILLVSLLHKVINSRREPRPLIATDGEGQLHPWLSATGISWDLYRSDGVYLSLPNSLTSNFVVLTDFRCGADGRVLLICSETRSNLAVVKILFPPKGDVTPVEDLCDKESELWRTIYGVPARTIQVAVSRYAILMPFAFICRAEDDHEGRRHSFRPLLRFHGEESTTAASDEVYIKDENIAELLVQLDPERIARDAVDTVVGKGYVHRDVHWRHVAALPVWNSDGRIGGFRGILIDLSNVPTLTTERLTPARAKEVMLESLGLQP